MSDEVYRAREGTYYAFKQQRLAADPTWTVEKELAAKRAAAAGEPLPPAPPPVAAIGDDHLQARLSVSLTCLVGASLLVS